MATTSNNLKYRGNYRQYDSRGYEVAYTMGDVVVYNGKQYVSKTNNKKSIPTKINTEWEILTANYKNFYYSETTPLNADVGDRWVDSVSGRMYTYIEDTNGFHWVEF